MNCPGNQKQGIQRLLNIVIPCLFATQTTLPLEQTLRDPHSLRSKRFREAKSEEKAKNGGFGVLPARKWGESKNKKEGVGEGKEGNACRQTP